MFIRLDLDELLAVQHHRIDQTDYTSSARDKPKSKKNLPGPDTSSQWNIKKE